MAHESTGAIYAAAGANLAIAAAKFVGLVTGSRGREVLSAAGFAAP